MKTPCSSPPSRSLPVRTLRSALCLSALAALGLHAQSPTAPSAKLPADVIDQQWADGNSKYDGARSAILKEVDRQIFDGPYRADWQTLANYQPPEWYKDAKFGIFIHWGLYSVPAFGNEWYPRNMYVAGSPENKHQIATYGPLTSFGYKDFIPLFKAEHYDPQLWARLFKDAGAKYVVPVFEHHDGFAMYDSGVSDWTAAKMGPHRDLAGDLAKAVRAEGLHLGASSHRVEHDWFLEHGRETDSDVNDPKYAAFYGPAHHHMQQDPDPLLRDYTYASPAYLKDWLARSAEIVEKYHPDIMYFDWWIGQPYVRPYITKFAAFYYNASLSHGGPIGVINYKDDAMMSGSAVLDIERGQLAQIRPSYWQTDTSISNGSWGYIKNDSFKSSDFLVHQLIDIVSKNGNLLLNIGPRSDGVIPDEVQQVLLGMGDWLKTNGEAIYGARPWKVYGEGPTRVAEGKFHDTETKPYTAEDFRFTIKGPNVGGTAEAAAATTLYAVDMAWPAGGAAVIHSLGSGAASAPKVVAVSLLGSDAKIAFDQQADGLHLTLPAQAPGKYAYTFRITLAASGM
ncbi:MAG TPA: alpha-L-fucosidase [Acidisarcina sp.]